MEEFVPNVKAKYLPYVSLEGRLLGAVTGGHRGTWILMMELEEGYWFPILGKKKDRVKVPRFPSRGKAIAWLEERVEVDKES